jgi:hypothetical protein
MPGRPGVLVAEDGKQVSPKELAFQVANMWTELTARGVYAMVRNGKEREKY